MPIFLFVNSVDFVVFVRCLLPSRQVHPVLGEMCNACMRTPWQMPMILVSWCWLYFVRCLLSSRQVHPVLGEMCNENTLTNANDFCFMVLTLFCALSYATEAGSVSVGRDWCVMRTWPLNCRGFVQGHCSLDGKCQWLLFHGVDFVVLCIVFCHRGRFSLCWEGLMCDENMAFELSWICTRALLVGMVNANDCCSMALTLLFCAMS